ncbi:hypothetical protein tb265_00850 [Gemmatimonadetes bacterium T265]|nr:hypothetical protein tb265_00850 [Gemmatimonadetes bacterium T265]
MCAAVCGGMLRCDEPATAKCANPAQTGSRAGRPCGYWMGLKIRAQRTRVAHAKGVAVSGT